MTEIEIVDPEVSFGNMESDLRRAAFYLVGHASREMKGCFDGLVSCHDEMLRDAGSEHDRHTRDHLEEIADQLRKTVAIIEDARQRLYGARLIRKAAVAEFVDRSDGVEMYCDALEAYDRDVRDMQRAGLDRSE